MEKIKETLSVCPICFKEIKADVVEDKNIFLIKKCEKHGQFKCLLEKDINLYHKLMNKDFLAHRLEFTNLIIPITFRCNLHCSVCYSAKTSKVDLSIRQIKKIISNYKGRSMVISGGEPTTRKELPEIVSIISMHNTPILATNGIKLASYDYVRKLKKSGLKYILFSLDALDEKIYKKIGKDSLLKKRLKALENIKKVGMKVILSMMLVANVNESEIKKIFDFCIKNHDFIREMRIRSMAPVGRYFRKKKYHLSELMEIVCESIGVDKQALLKEFDFWSLIWKNFKNKEYVHRPCSFTFHLKVRNGKVSPLFEKFSIEKFKNFKFKRLLLLFYLVKIFGFSILVRYILNNFDGLKTLFDSKEFFKISLRSWPTKHDIDLQEIERCQTGYVLNNEKTESFCYINSVRNLCD